MKTPLARLKQYWIFLLWIGLFLLVAGAVAGLLTGEWMTTPTLMIIFGTTSLSMWATGQDRVTKGFWSRRSTEIGTNAIVSTLATLGILAAINVLGARYSVRADLTESQRFTLAPESIAIAETLEAPVKVWVFSLQPNPDDEALLENYRRVSDGQIDFEYVAPQARPGLVQEFGVTADGEVYLEAGEDRQFVQTIDLNGLSEAQLSNRIAQLGAGAASKVYFLQGHGERSIVEAQQDGMTRVVKALEEKNFAIEPLTLTGSEAATEIPGDAAVLAIVSPTSALFENELAAISDYLDGGGRVLLTLDPNTEPELDEFASSWGIELGTGIAIDPERWVQGLGPAAPLAIDYGQHPIAQDFGQNYSLFPVVKPLRIVEEITDAEDIVVQPLAFTSDASWEEMDLDEGPDWEQNEEDRPGPLILAAALSKPVEMEEAAATPAVESDAAAEDGTAQEESNSAIEAETSAEETPEAEVTEEEAIELEEAIEEEPSDTEAPADEAEEPESTDEEDPEDGAAIDETEPIAAEEADESPEETGETGEADEPTVEARLVIFGDSDFLTDSFFDNQLNGDFFLNAIGWLAEVDEAQLSIRAKESTERTLTLTPATARFLAWTALATFPAIGFGASAILWWKRR
ncbi:MAG: Gldg family protein [Geitlerinemataceae cyanobacterium]